MFDHWIGYRDEFDSSVYYALVTQQWRQAWIWVKCWDASVTAGKLRGKSAELTQALY